MAWHEGGLWFVQRACLMLNLYVPNALDLVYTLIPLGHTLQLFVQDGMFRHG